MFPLMNLSGSPVTGTRVGFVIVSPQCVVEIMMMAQVRSPFRNVLGRRGGAGASALVSKKSFILAKVQARRRIES